MTTSKPIRSERRFLEREAVRLTRERIRHGSPSCHCCQRPLQSQQTLQPDYAYVVRGRAVCIGCLLPALKLPHAVADRLPVAAVEYEAAARSHAKQHYVDDRQRERLREHLFKDMPYCNRCGRELHNRKLSSHTPNYAHLVGGRLSCRECVKIVRALAEVESEVAL